MEVGCDGGGVEQGEEREGEGDGFKVTSEYLITNTMTILSFEAHPLPISNVPSPSPLQMPPPPFPHPAGQTQDVSAHPNCT